MQRHVRARAVIVFGKKLLCVQHKATDGTGKNFWCLPGGKVDPGEALIPALRREMEEETGVTPEVGNLLYIQQFTHEGAESLEFFFHVANAKDYEKIDLSGTTHGTAEIAAIDFIDPAVENVLPTFLQTEPLTDVINAAGPPKLFSE